MGEGWVRVEPRRHSEEYNDVAIAFPPPLILTIHVGRVFRNTAPPHTSGIAPGPSCIIAPSVRPTELSFNYPTERRC